MNSAVTITMNRNELAYTETIHKRSRRALHKALRRSAGESGRADGWRRFTSNSTIKAAKSTIVTKKNRSFRTMGPMRAISSLFFFQAEDGIRDYKVTGVQTCALPISEYMDGQVVLLEPAQVSLVT